MQDERKERQREAIKVEAARRGIKVERRARSYLLHGVGVYVIARDLADLDFKDLAPYIPRERVES